MKVGDRVNCTAPGDYTIHDGPGTIADFHEVERWNAGKSYRYAWVVVELDSGHRRIFRSQDVTPIPEEAPA